MASSTYDFRLNREEMTKKALQIIGVLPEGQSPNTEQLDDASVTLNMLSKAYAAEGLVSWGLTSYTLFTHPRVGRYRLSSSYSRRWTPSSSYNYAKTAADQSIGDTLITLAAAPDNPFSDTPVFNAGHTALVQLDNGAFLYTNIDTYLTNTTFYIHTALPDTMAAGNLVYITDEVAPKPGRISNAYRSTDDNYDTPLSYLAFKDYQELSNKAQIGIPNTYSYVLTPTTMNLYLWPVPEKGMRIVVLAEAAYEDLDDSSDYPTISNEVYLAFVWELASLLSVEYGADLRMIREISSKAKAYKETALGFADEKAYIKFEPDLRYGRF